MIYNIRNFVLVYVTVVIFSSYTFAPWKSQPVPPPVGTTNQCYHWLFYDGFKDWLFYDGFKGNDVEDKKLVKSRETKYDQDVSYFAAAYAYLLSNSLIKYRIFDFGLSEFCDLHTFSFVEYPYITLKDAEFTCEGWIDLYIHDKRRYYKQNDEWAANRDESVDNRISLWAALYFQYITSNDLNAKKTPSDFCILMGKPVMNVPLPSKYSFMTFDGSKMSCIGWQEIRTEKYPLEENIFAEKNSKNVTKLQFISFDTKMTCFEWIKLWGFSNDNLINLEIILKESVYVNSVNSSTRKYITYVKYIIEEYRRHFDQNLGHVVDSLLVPTDYCEIVMNLPETILINYFGEI